jgi:hypothetical protein
MIDRIVSKKSLLINIINKIDACTLKSYVRDETVLYGSALRRGDGGDIGAFGRRIV